MMVNVIKGGGRALPTLTSQGYFYPHDWMYARKQRLQLCVLCGIHPPPPHFHLSHGVFMQVLPDRSMLAGVLTINADKAMTEADLQSKVSFIYWIYCAEAAQTWKIRLTFLCDKVGGQGGQSRP